MYPQFFLICSLFNISAFHLAPPPTSKFRSSHVQTGSRSLRYFYVVFLFPKTPRRPSKYRNTSEESESFVKRFLRRGISLTQKLKGVEDNEWKIPCLKRWEFIVTLNWHFWRTLSPISEKEKIDGQYERLKFNREIRHRDIEDTSRLTKPRRRGGLVLSFRCWLYVVSLHSGAELTRRTCITSSRAKFVYFHLSLSRENVKRNF